MAYTVGTGQGQLNAANYNYMMAPPGMNPSTDYASLRAKYPGLRTLSDQQVANYDAWETYLNAEGPQNRDARARQAWSTINSSNNRALMGAMPDAYGYDASGNLQWMPEGYKRDPQTGQMVQQNIFVRKPWLGPALGVGAIAGGTTLASALGGGGAPAAASTTTGAGTAGAAGGTAAGAGSGVLADVGLE